MSAAPLGSLSGARPARRGEFISIFATGLGPVTNRPASGAAAPADPLASSAIPEVFIGGAASVSFAGLAPGFVGLYQVNAQVPDGTRPGADVPVFLRLEGRFSRFVTIAVE